MAFLIDAAARRHYGRLYPIANGDIRRVLFRRSVVAAVKAACEIVAALMLIVATMVALALFQIWAWVPHLIR
jgi:hypothetical protein